MLATVEHYEDTKEAEGDDGIDEQDDFFAANDGVSTEDIFTQVRIQKTTIPSSSVGRTSSGRPSNSLSNYDIMPYQYQKRNKKPNKSMGLKTHNQSKREYESFQHRYKRQKLFRDSNRWMRLRLRLFSPRRKLRL